MDKSTEEKLAFHQKAKFIDAFGETNMSSALKTVEKHNNSYIPLLEEFKRNHPDSVGRVKSVPSTIKKIIRKEGERLGDIAGSRIITRNFCELQRVSKEIEKENPVIAQCGDDYYKKPLGGIYYARHFSIPEKGCKIPSRIRMKSCEDIKCRKIEVQVKTQRMDDFHNNETHKAYKKYGTDLPPAIFQRLKKRAEELKRLDEMC